MKINPILLLQSLLLLVIYAYQPLYAQKNKKEVFENNISPKEISIDGQMPEWPNSLFIENKACELSYLISNNDTTLYLVLKSKPGANLRKFLIGGISFSINTRGEKKPWQTITFPLLQNRARTQTRTNQKPETDPLKQLNTELLALRAIDVKGFDQILDGKIALNNEFGINAAAGINTEGMLVCEYAIPLKLLQINNSKNDIIACQIKVNGLDLPENAANSDRNNNARMLGLPNSMGTARTTLPDWAQGASFWILTRLADSKKD